MGCSQWGPEGRKPPAEGGTDPGERICGQDTEGRAHPGNTAEEKLTECTDQLGTRGEAEPRKNDTKPDRLGAGYSLGNVHDQFC